MNSRLVLACVLGLMAAGCSRLPDEEALMTQLYAHESRLADLDQRFLGAREFNQGRMDGVESNLQALIVQLRVEVEANAVQLALLTEFIAGLDEKQVALDLLVAKLQSDTEQMTVQLSRLQTARPAPARRLTQQPSAPKPTTATAPDFQIMGIELRGGRTFVAVAPQSAASLGEVRLLEPGDEFAGWALGRIGSTTAEFVSKAGTVELSVR